MKVVIQRVLQSKVTINNTIHNEIDSGMMILVGFTQNDTIEDINYIINKIIKLRIFDDENGKMNKSIQDINGQILSISQFTLYADTKNGNRPSYINALNGQEAAILYADFNEKLNQHIPTKSGIFGSEMKIELINDGPITIIIDSKNK